MTSRPVMIVIGIALILLVSGGAVFYYFSSRAAPPTQQQPQEIAQYLSGLPNYYPANYSTIITKAKAESGTLVIYAAFPQANFGPVVEAFQQRYPFIKVQYLNMPTETTMTRYMAEASANKPTADVVVHNSLRTGYDVMINQSQALNYCSPEQTFYPPNFGWSCRVFTPMVAALVFLVNTKVVPADQVPTGFVSLDNIVKKNPNFWKGRVGGYDFSNTVTNGLAGLAFAYNESTVVGWFKTLKDYSGYQRFTSAALSGELVASGQLYVTMGSLAVLVPIHDKTGNATKFVFPDEGTYVYPCLMSITKRAANPYSAMLFVDYYLSKEGQAVQLNAYYASARVDLPPQISPWTWTNIVKLAGGQTKVLNDSFPPRYSTEFQNHVVAEWTKALAT